MDIVLDFTYGKRNEFRKGTKRVNVAERYEGHKRSVIVYYFDDRKDLGAFACCQTPSTCKNEASAIQCIKKFFKA